MKQPQIIGVTGTEEPTAQQKMALSDLLDGFRKGHTLHHGACVGADEDGARSGHAHGYKVVAHPPVNRKKLSRSAIDLSHEVRDPKPYLARDHDVVDECDLLIAVPKWRGLSAEPPKGTRGEGTLATINYARKVGRRITFIWPSGLVQDEFTYKS